MNTQSLSRILAGLLILLVGVGALLDSLGIFSFWQLASTWWPLAVIAAGVLSIIANARQYITGVILIAVGVILQLSRLDMLQVNVWSLIWPAAIIAVGVSVLFNHTSRPKNVSKEGRDDISAVFAGSETINKTQNYQGGKITAIFGGVGIDLRDANIVKTATIDVFALCGGIEIRIPREWRVEYHVTPILGGVESKQHSEKATDKSPLLIITGTVALGGVEVKS